MDFNFKDEKSKKIFEKQTNHSKPKNRNHNKGYKKKDSFSIDKTKIPKDTREVLNNLKDIDNFNLKLNKFARFDISDIKKTNEEKFIFYRNKAKDLEDIEIKINFGDFNFKDNIENQEKYIKAIFKKNIQNFSFKTDYRLLIGSEQSIYETSLRLHHIYGIPYIPASAIKGVARSYIIIEKFDSKEEKALEDKDFKKVFGSQEQEGRVIFFDAFPITKPTIKVDIMNPHYGGYYNEGKAPTDDKNPVPINFLTVENTEFKFFIASKESLESFKIKDKTIEEWLKEALHNHGIGAKSAVGYGYFNEL